MGDDNTNQKKRKFKWIASYSNMTNAQAEKRLGFRVRSVKAISVDTMLANAGYSFGRECPDAILKTKEAVYDSIVQYLIIEGYPTEGDPDLKEANIHDLVYAIISPVLVSFIRMTGRQSIQLRREKEIISTDGETGGLEEFVMVDLVSVEDEKFVLIIEAKKNSLGQAMKQCLLAMKDMSDNNGGGEVYGFVTTGEHWRMLRFDGTSFVGTNTFSVLFETMETDKDEWLKNNSVVVDCMYAALNNGAIVKND